MKIKVNAAVVDTQELVLYCVDGTTHKISQGNPALAKVIKDITPILSANKIAEIDLDSYNEVPANPYKHHEENSGGIVKFFKVTKKRLTDFFKKDEEPATVALVPPMAVSVIQLDEQEPKKEVAPAPVVAAPVEEDSKWVDEMISKTVAKESAVAAEKALSAVAEIMQHAVPTSSPEFDKPTDATETVVAVVGGKVIDNVSRIEPHIKAAGKLKNYVGVTKFLERVASVADKRRHSVEDLMKFMERGDLPIADDGSIIIYKILNKKDDHFVDCHTGNVPQKVGSYVCMDESLVDQDRRNECSNGLHVARKHYLSNFAGNVCVIAKVAPEDVIAVPQYDANKMRVCGYHIIFQLSDEEFSLAKSGQSFTEEQSAKQLLGKAISGDHIGKTEEVRITGHKGTGIVVISLMTPQEKVESAADNLITSVDPQVETVDVVLRNTAAPVNPMDVVAATEAAPAVAPTEEKTVVVVVKTPKEPDPAKEPKKEAGKPPTRAEKAKALYARAKAAKGRERLLLATELLNFKAAAKVSWSSLGISDKEVENLKTWAK